MRRLLIALLVGLLGIGSAEAAGTFNSLPQATVPLGNLPDDVPMDQGTGCPTVGPSCTTSQVSSLRLGQPIQTTCSAIPSPFPYQQCIDTSVTPNVLKEYIGSTWFSLYTLSPSSGLVPIYTTPIPVSAGGTGRSSLGSGLPLFGAGTSPITTGTLSGNTTELATVSGAVIDGHCPQFDSFGNLVDSGATCPVYEIPTGTILGNNAGVLAPPSPLMTLPFTLGTSVGGTGATSLGSAFTNTGGAGMEFDFVVGGSPNTGAQSATIATLEASCVGPVSCPGGDPVYPNGATSLGVTAEWDASPLYFSASNVPCTQNAGAGDGITQVPSADGKCFVAVVPATGLDIRRSGAKCNNIANDQAAINALLNNGSYAYTRIILPPTPCLVGQNGSNPWALNETVPVSIYGNNEFESGFRPAPGLPSSADVLRITTNATYAWTALTLKNFFIGNNALATRTGRHAIYLDTQIAGGVVAYLDVDQVWMQAATTDGGRGFYHINNPVNNVNGAFSLSSFTRSIFGGGASFNYSGDSLHFSGDQFAGTNPSDTLYVNQIPGAGNFVVDGASSIELAGGVVFDCAVSPRLEGSELEQQVTNSEANNAVVDFLGSVCKIDHGIFASQIQSNPSLGNPTLVRVDTADSIDIDRARLATPANYPAIVNTGNATNTTLGPGLKIVTSSPYLNDSGTGTVNYYGAVLTWIAYTPTITCDTGTLTTLGGVTGFYQVLGKVVNVKVKIPITTNGTCAGYLIATLPLPVQTSNDFFLAGMEQVGATGIIGRAVLNTSTMFIYTPAGTYPGGTGTQPAVSGTYETN